MTTHETRLLIECYAELCALFEPEREDCFRTFAWQYRAKWTGPAFAPAGVLPWKNSGDDTAARKAIDRARNGLVESGHLRQSGRDVGLTDSGIAGARRIIGHFQLSASLPAVDFIHSLLGGPHEWVCEHGGAAPLGGWFSESSLAGATAWPRVKKGKPQTPVADHWVVDAMLPLLIAGLAVADFHPSFFAPLYRLTGPGREMAERRVESGEADPGGWFERVMPAAKSYAMQGFWDEAGARFTDCENIFSAAWQRRLAELPSLPALNVNVVKHASLNAFFLPRNIIEKHNPKEGKK
jgi:hypothetical protein